MGTEHPQVSQRGEGSEGGTSFRFLLRANKIPQNRGWEILCVTRWWIPGVIGFARNLGINGCHRGFLPYLPDFLKEPIRPLTISLFSGPFLREHMARKRDCDVHLRQLSQFWENGVSASDKWPSSTASGWPFARGGQPFDSENWGKTSTPMGFVPPGS